MTKDPSIPPSFSTSWGLFFSTIIGLVGLYSAYFFWYSTDIPTQQQEHRERIIRVKLGEDLNAIIRTASPGTIVELAPGRWEANIRIINKAITLRSSSDPGETEIWAEKGSVLTIEDATQCTIQGIQFNSEDKNQPLVVLSHVSKAIFRENIFHSPFIALQLHRNCTEITLEKNKIYFQRVGISAKDTAQINLRQNTIKAEPFRDDSLAISFVEVQQCLVEENEINSDRGMYCKKCVAQEGHLSPILKNTFATRGSCIEIEDSKDLSLTSNQCESQKEDALSINRCINIKVGTANVDNKLKSIAKRSLLINGCKDILIQNGFLHNQSSDTPAVIIQFSSNIKLWKSEVTGLFVYKEGTTALEDSKGGGVKIVHANEVQLKDNTINQGAFDGIRVEQDSEVSLIANSIERNGNYGLDIENSTVTIGPNNRIVDNVYGGVRVRNGKGAIRDSIIANNQYSGVELEDASLQVVNNDIHHNGGDGLSLKNSFPEELRGNRFHSNKGFGINFLQRKTIDWKDNIFEANERGRANK